MHKLALALLLAMAPCLAAAQQAGKVYRVGGLGAGLAGPDSCGGNMGRFGNIVRLTLRDAGFVDGQNLAFEMRCYQTQAQLDAMADELATRNLDAAVTWGVRATRALKARLRVPIVFIGSADPVRDGLVANFTRPGGNVTGLSNESADLLEKRRQLNRELLGDFKTVAIMYVRGDEDLTFISPDPTGIEVRRVPVSSWEEIEATLIAMRQHRPDVLQVAASSWLWSHTARLFPLATEVGIPTTCSFTLLVERGCLISYSVDFVELSGQGGRMLSRILRGSNPAEMPVEQGIKHELWINANTAKALSITIPPSLLARADRVIE